MRIDKGKLIYAGISVVIFLLAALALGRFDFRDRDDEQPGAAAYTAADPQDVTAGAEEIPAIDEDGSYFSRDEVALYIHTYGHLPKNFVTKQEAEAAGWHGGSVEDCLPGCAIGGDYFGNYEEILPKDKNYRECDIDTNGSDSRGERRIIYSDDGCIYYTDDHYESFTELYGGK